MHLTLKEAKEKLETEIGKEFLDQGFTFNRSEFKFSKKIGQNKVVCKIVFYYYPHYKILYNFRFASIIQEIEQEEKRLCSFLGKQYEKGYTLYFLEGDFQPAVKNELVKYRMDFAHSLMDQPSDKIVIKQSRQFLIHEFFPLVQMISTLDGFQRFILDDFNNVIHFRLFRPSLLAMKLKGDKEFYKLVDYLKVHWQYENLDVENIDRKMIEDVIYFKEN